MSGCAPDGRIDRASPMNEAAEWLILGEENFDAGQRNAFEQWVNADAANRTAYEELAASWETLGEAGDDPRIQHWRREALTSGRHRARWLVGAGTAIAASISLFYIAPAFQQPSPQSQPVAMHPIPLSFATAQGEIRTIALADGSRMILDTNTHVDVILEAGQRRIFLKSGQALFEVAHDRNRPFLVNAGDREVLAVGTEFSVHREKDNVAVALIDGRVEVRGHADAPTAINVSAVQLSPGERLQFVIADSASVITSVDIKSMTRWREGRVRFDDTPLAEAVAEMNRYSAVPLEIADRRLDSLRISGVFRTTSTESFVTALTMSFPVSTRRNENGIELSLEPRPN